MAELLVCYFDGLAEPNPGVACAGWAIAWPAGSALPAGGHRHVGHGTNNQAEYEAALACLRAVYRAGYRGAVLLRGDSQIVIKQFNGVYGCHSDVLMPLLAQLRRAATCFSSLTLEWIPREQNEAADAQSRLAYRALRGHEPPARARKETPPRVQVEPLVGAVLQFGAPRPFAVQFPPVEYSAPHSARKESTGVNSRG